MSFEEYLFERFGISLPFYVLFEETEKRVIAYTSEKKGEKYGLIAAKKGASYKPTTNFLQLYGNLALRNVVYLSREEAEMYMEGKDVEIENRYAGYVAVCFGNECLGCGLAKDGLLINQVPKVRRIHKN